jgi:cyclic pyranopterin phosphate synthase
MNIDEQLIDGFGRKVDYLRVSVTDFCNLRCRYCMPAGGVQPLNHDEILTFEEIRDVVHHAASFGIRKIRLTGGEPLVRHQIVKLVKLVAGVPGVETVAMTTNGTLLPEFAGQLRDAGLDRVNVSLDSLRPDTLEQITRSDFAGRAVAGIEAAQQAGLNPVKVNVVVMKGVNDGEIPDFVNFARQRQVEVRFIEYMPHCDGENDQSMFVSEQEILGRIRETVSLSPVERTAGCGPAERFRIEGTDIKIGVIPSVSRPACSTCNRLRLRADGALVACLYEGGKVDLKQLLRSGAARDDIRAAFESALVLKPREHSHARSTTMNRLGG